MSRVWENFWKSLLEDHRGTTIGTCFGLVLGILYLFFGFWQTLVFSLFVGGGFFFGRRFERRDDMRGLLEKLFPDRFFRR